MIGQLEPCEITKTVKWREVLAMVRKHGGTKEEAQRIWDRDKNTENYSNETYHVNVDKHDPHGFGDDIEVWTLSIKRHDRAPICDWRDLQAIKNQICGEEHEGMMLYPAEARVVDTANQYWMYVFMTPGFVIPCGFPMGVKTDDPGMGKAKQRPRS